MTADASGDAQKIEQAVAEQAKPVKKPETLLDNVKTIIYALGLALVLRVFLFQPFNIPSESMRPNLLVGDYIFVSKWDYGYSKHSIPFSPNIFSGRIMGSTPARGDIVVFKLPRDGQTDYIKRVIGLPGDRVQIANGAVILNGAPIKRERLDDDIQSDAFGNIQRFERWRETNPEGRTYQTYNIEDGGQFDDTGVYVVPEGHLFMMGDNRDNSLDSRAPMEIGVGFVPMENVVGRARLIFLSFEEDTKLYLPWTWFTGLRLDRIAVTAQ
jgi:signal peptidase I